jgi:membrane protease YdiL (CAAX protease family)
MMEEKRPSLSDETHIPDKGFESKEIHSGRIGSILLLFFLLIIWPLSSYLLMKEQQPQLSATGFEGINLSTQIYLPTILIQLLVFLLITLVLRLEKESFSSIGLKGFDLRNLLIGVFSWFGMSFLLLMMSFLLRSYNLSTSPEVLKLLPRTTPQKFLWIVMAMSASLAEESAFRGFVLTRLNIYLKNWWLTILIASISFSLGHLYQGTAGTIFAGIYGILFSFLFLWRKSLAPCMTAHFLQDATPLFAPLS